MMIKIETQNKFTKKETPSLIYKTPKKKLAQASLNPSFSQPINSANFLYINNLTQTFSCYNSLEKARISQ